MDATDEKHVIEQNVLAVSLQEVIELWLTKDACNVILKPTKLNINIKMHASHGVPRCPLED